MWRNGGGCLTLSVDIIPDYLLDIINRNSGFLGLFLNRDFALVVRDDNRLVLRGIFVHFHIAVLGEET